MLDVFLFVLGYVVILGITSAIHYHMGYQRGITDTITSFRKFEPRAVESAMKKMKVELEAQLDDKE